MVSFSVKSPPSGSNGQQQHQKDLVEPLRHFAGRSAVGQVDGSVVGVTVRKRGARHIRLNPETGEEEEFLVVGGACGECFSGRRLAAILAPGLAAEQRALRELEEEGFAANLSIHTSAGLPPALPDFLNALVPHLPWAQPGDDWFCSLQLEGGTAVFAAIDLLMQLQVVRGHPERTKIAVAECSYHGPPATAPGGPNAPLFRKDYQVVYPAPTLHRQVAEEGLEAEFKVFLQQHAHEVAVILFEPQWGSSNAAKPWPRAQLQRFIHLAHEEGLLVLCDEVMCGLGRHGLGTTFLSRAWDLDADAVTFGKAAAAGVFPLSGALLRRGGTELRQAGRAVMHMHTYAGASQKALLAGIEVLRLLEKEETARHIQAMGEIAKELLGRLEEETGGRARCQGHGLMWGGTFVGSSEQRVEAENEFRKQCSSAKVWPYFVKGGDFMVTPVLDVAEEDFRQAMGRLAQCVKLTVARVHGGADGEAAPEA